MKFAKIEWILQDKCFGGEQADLISAILEKEDQEVIVGIPDSIDHHNFRVIRGSTKFVDTYNRMFEEYDPFCITCNFDNYICSRYYQKIHHNDLLNSYCVWMPWGYLSTDIFELFQTEKVFIRPDVGYKVFTGTTIGKKWFSKELEVIKSLPSTSGLTDNTMVLLSTCKKIIREARFLMGPSGLIDGSWYNEEGNNLQLKTLGDFANRAGRHYDDFYTVDVADTEEYGPQIVEVNSFSSAGLYDMHAPTVVDAITQYITESTKDED